jgi:hypothetical protein
MSRGHRVVRPSYRNRVDCDTDVSSQGVQARPPHDVAAGSTYYAVLAVVRGLVIIAILGLVGKNIAPDVFRQVSELEPRHGPELGGTRPRRGMSPKLGSASRGVEGALQLFITA